VDKQEDLVYDVIVGRDFLKQEQARMCYDSRTVTFLVESTALTKHVFSSKAGQGPGSHKMLKLPRGA
jgi:hypothetical protein